MKNKFLISLKEAVFSVIPIVLLIILLNFTPLYTLQAREIFAFIFSSILLIFGIALITIGADISMTQIGKDIGEGLTSKKKFSMLFLISFLIGFLLTMSEPDLEVLATQLSSLVAKPIMIFTVSAGVGLMLLIGILKIFYKKSLSSLLLFFYFLMFSISVMVVVSGNDNLLPLSFDAGGVTTGPVAAPFILALGFGIANTINSRTASENSFGLISLCSIGAIVGVLILSIFIDGNIDYQPAEYALSDNIFLAFFENIPTISKQVGLSIGLVVIVFLICQVTILKLEKKHLIDIFVGILIIFVGLTIFLDGVEISFIDISYKIGCQLVENASLPIILIFCFAIGTLVVLAEPAIQVLVKQISDITNGMISNRSVLISLAFGVGLAVALSMLRVIYKFDLMYLIVPSYIISLGLSFFVPPVYTAVAFDSGGVATGTMASSFLLPLMMGACTTLNGSNSILMFAFGIIAMISVIPLITIQLLGFGTIIKKKRERKIIMSKIISKDDKQIINFK